jgi:1-acyl-sn-glycerol-3-phosphate acyltransferase
MMAEAEIIPIDRRTASQTKPRCRATTASGRPCRNYAVDERGYCRVHAPGGLASSGRTEAARPPAGRKPKAPTGSSGLLAGAEDFVRRRLSGDYRVDDFGYDEMLSRELLLPLAKPLYENYFRVRTLGIERIPNEGPAVLIANHSGTVALDAVMVQYAVARKHPAKRAVRNIGADLVYRLPFVGPLARKTGNAVACPDDAYELLRRGELLGIFPEGFKGVGKGWRERYKLQRFGRAGFMEIALRAQVPIIPIAVVGAEEAFPMIGNARGLARLLGLPYFPITPTFPLLGPLGLLPLPSRWFIEFGHPIPTDEYAADAADDAMLVFDLADRVRDTIQQMLYRNLNARGGAFF